MATELLLPTPIMEFPEFDSKINRPLEVKNAEFQEAGRLKHLINAAQLTPDFVEDLCGWADMIRLLSREKSSADEMRRLLSHRRAMLYFTQPSTRTFLSFMAACQILGLTCNEVRDPKTSSEVKRESRMDAVRMFSSYFDILIMRSPLVNFAECCSYLMNDLEAQNMRSVPIVNAGSGADEHPTQALLDVYTLRRTFEFRDRDGSDQRFQDLQGQYKGLSRGLASKTYTFCGDIGRGRTVRSLAIVLSQYANIRMFFVSPEQSALRLDDKLRTKLQSSGVEVFEFDSLDAELDGKKILGQTDCLYMTRIQREHNSEKDEHEIDAIDLSSFQLTPHRASLMKNYAPIMHPFPRDSHIQEIPSEIDQDPRAMYFRQARNGMWARGALLAHVFQVTDELSDLYETAIG